MHLIFAICFGLCVGSDAGTKARDAENLLFLLEQLGAMESEAEWAVFIETVLQRGEFPSVLHKSRNKPDWPAGDAVLEPR